MKENLLLPKDSLEPEGIKFINTWLKYQTTHTAHHSTTKIKPVDVKSNTCIDSSKKINPK